MTLQSKIKNIGLLKTSDDIRRKLLNLNIGENNDKFEVIGINEKIEKLPYHLDSINGDGLLGFTHRANHNSGKEIAEKINDFYHFGDYINYYTTTSNRKNKEFNQWDKYDDYISWLKFNFNFNSYTKDVLEGMYTYKYDEEEGRKRLLGLDNKKFAITYSVLTDFLQYDNIKHALEKTRIGVVEPNPLASLNGSVITNINNFNGTDTKLGLINNQVYAQTLKKGAQFNSIRNTPYITPEIYAQLGNKLSTLSLLSSSLRIDETTGRLLYNLGDGFGIIEYNEDIDFSLFEEKNRHKNSNLNGLYNNFRENYDYFFNTPFNQYKKPNINNFYFNKLIDFSTEYTWDDLNNENLSIFNNNESKLLETTLNSFTKDENGEVKNGTLITRFHTSKGSDENHNKISQFQSAVTQFGLSHGRNLLNRIAYTTGQETDGNPYCRTWTKYHQYKSLNDTIRNFKDVSFENLQSNIKYDSSHFINHSIFNANSLPKIVPSNVTDIQKCMFSIENLAWKGTRISSHLSPEQIGPNLGRIMWFPPYNLKFNESVTANWNPNSFIGRGEKIYTYTDTERMGTLSFTLLIDHPSIINKWSKNNKTSDDDSEQLLLRFLAGADMLNTSDEHNKKYENITESENDVINADIDNIINGDKIISYIFFDLKSDKKIPFDETLRGVLNKNINELNKYYSDATNVWSNINKDLFKGKDVKNINIYSYSSSEEKEIWNLSKKRGKFIKDELRKLLDTKKEQRNTKLKNVDFILCDNKDKNKPDSRSVIKATCVKIEINFSQGKKIVDSKDINSDVDVEKINVAPVNNLNNNTNNSKINALGGKIVTSSFVNENQIESNDELKYFNNIQKENEFLYNKIVDKVKYFIPAFHSMTPEGFNARLGFLHQCTRQGGTISVSNEATKSAGNMAFGRPPICVLRIGDFYHTKIIIQNMTINYDTSNAVQWDLNPEGIGVQPIYADISLNFTFLGGSDISAPISRLQNAVSFNYYANQSVYDYKADRGKYDNNKPIIDNTPFNPY